MSYQVIARKWRPQTFEEVTGQEPITRTLRNAIEHERLHHAYLFTGSRGVGKTTTARLLAKALNCHKSPKPTATPCRTDDPDACVSCQEISEGRSIDVQEIDAASNTGVDSVRDVILDDIGYKASVWEGRDRYKVFIIDEVHMLSSSSFNALLKTLEEPPPLVTFIMATTERHKLPDTILSRVQQFEFRTISTDRIAERLRFIADAEKIQIAPDALREIARAGEGSMRDAQSAFDQVISFTGTKIKAEDVETALGLASTEMLTRVTRSLAESAPAEALAVVDDLVMRGHDLRNFCRDLLAHLRDLLVAKVSGDAALLNSAATDRRSLLEQAKEFSESDLVRFFHSLTETETNLRTAAHPRYQLEVGLVKLIEVRRVVPLNNLIERLAALEESLRTGVAPIASKTPPTAAGGSAQGGVGGISGSGVKPNAFQNASTSRAGASASGSSAKSEGTDVAGYMQSRTDDAPFGGVGGTAVQPTPPNVMQQQSNVLTLVPPPGPPAAAAAKPALTTASSSALTAHHPTIEAIKAELEKRSRMFLVIAIEGARKATVEGDEIYIEFAPEAKHLRDNLAKPESVRLLREVAREVTGRDLGVRVNVKERGENGANEPLSKQEVERDEKQRLREIAEQNPIVQKALRTFRGEIIDVRKIEE
jgi:DNA polymerase-3 subunit gamma/tau